MDIHAFPEIENFQKLPKQVIVKAGSMAFDDGTGAVLHGIVINNIGNPVCDIRVSIVLFDENKIPILNTSTVPDPSALPQGGMANFKFEFHQKYKDVTDFHLYTNWRFYE